MDGIVINYVSSNEGLIKSMPAAQRALGMPFRKIVRVAFIIVLGLIVLQSQEGRLIGWLYATFGDAPWPIMLPWATLAIIVVTVLVAALNTRAWTVRRFDQLAPPARSSLQMDDTGIDLSDDLSHSRWTWPAITGAVEAAGGIALLIGPGTIFIPGTAFGEQTTARQFIDYVQARITPR